MASEPSTVVRTRTFRAYLSRAGHANLGDLLRQLTWLWNAALSERRQAYQRDETRLSRFEQFGTLTRTRADTAWSRFPVNAQRSTLTRLDKAFQAFFRRVKAGEKPGFPRFKNERRGVRSFSMPCPKIRTNGKWSWISVKGIGRIRFRGFPEGRVKLLRIVRTARCVNIQFVTERAVMVEPDARPPVGIDVGINARVALSTGQTFPGVSIDRRELKRRQRRLSNAKRGSRNRIKRRKELAREWQKVREREKGALHELSAKIVRDHSANLAVEDLRIPNMVRNRRLARRIHEQQWGHLVRMLGYKAESAGGSVVLVDPRFTSQRCSGCGRRKHIGLSVRVYRCRCGHEQDRDVNAAANILQRAFGPNPGGALPGTHGAQRVGAGSAGKRVEFMPRLVNGIKPLNVRINGLDPVKPRAHAPRTP